MAVGYLQHARERVGFDHGVVIEDPNELGICPFDGVTDSDVVAVRVAAVVRQFEKHDRSARSGSVERLLGDAERSEIGAPAAPRLDPRDRVVGRAVVADDDPAWHLA